MSRVWVLNLDADQELALGARYAPTKKVQASMRAPAAQLAATLPEGDLWIDGPAPIPPGLGGACWCPTPRALARLAEVGATPPAAVPPFEVLRRVNGRSFASELGALEGEERIDDRESAERVLASGRWIVHREHTFAGRGHRFIDGPPSAEDLAWIRKGLALGPLHAAPRLAITLEVALHGYLGEAEVERGVVTVQQVDRGQWRRSVRAPEVLEPKEARRLGETFEQVAQALRDAGYRGPFGIDAFRHAGGFHPLSEINARYSMGWHVGMRSWRDGLLVSPE